MGEEHGARRDGYGSRPHCWKVLKSTQIHRTPRPSWNLTEFHLTVEGPEARDHQLVSGGTRICLPCRCFHPTATPPLLELSGECAEWQANLEGVHDTREPHQGRASPTEEALQTSGIGGFQVLATGTPKSMGFNFFNRGYLLLRATRSPQGWLI